MKQLKETSLARRADEIYAAIDHAILAEHDCELILINIDRKEYFFGLGILEMQQQADAKWGASGHYEIRCVGDEADHGKFWKELGPAGPSLYGLLMELFELSPKGVSRIQAIELIPLVDPKLREERLDLALKLGLVKVGDNSQMIGGPKLRRYIMGGMHAYAEAARIL